MKMRIKTAGNRAIIELRGPLIIGQPTEALMRSLQELLARRVGRLVVDLSGVPFADACGLGTLVECQKKVENAGAELRLRGAGPKLRELFRLTGLRITAPVVRPRQTLASRLRGTARGLRGPGVPKLRYLVA